MSVAGAGVGACMVVSGVVSVSEVYAGVGGGMNFTKCTNSSCSLEAISAFFGLFMSFLLYYNALESIYIIVTCILN